MATRRPIIDDGPRECGEPRDEPGWSPARRFASYSL